MMDVVGILEGWSPMQVQVLIEALETDGFISDEIQSGLSSSIIEHWDQECDDYLRSRGYGGGKIECYSQYSKFYGQIYVLFDPETISGESAMRLVSLIKGRKF